MSNFDFDADLNERFDVALFQQDMSDEDIFWKELDDLIDTMYKVEKAEKIQRAWRKYKTRSAARAEVKREPLRFVIANPRFKVSKKR